MTKTSETAAPVEREHSVFPPSSAKRHINCTPSLRLEELFPNTTSDAAEEGTVAHAFAEWKLYKLGGKELPMPSYGDYESKKDEIERHTDEYAQFVADWIKNGFGPEKAVLIPEHKVTFETWVPGGFGTADCTLISKSILHIIDFKYGVSVPVKAEDNTQMKIYALGALETWGKKFPDIRKIRMSIFQPRNREGGGTVDLTKDELLDWAENVLRPAAAQALAGKGEPNPGEWCRFCKAQTKCKAKTAELVAMFDEVDTSKKAALYTNEELIEFLPRLKAMSKWCDDAYNLLLDEAENKGLEIPGWTVKEGSRRESVTAKEEAVLVDQLVSLGFKKSDLYDTKLKSVAQLRKLVGKDRFDDKCGNYITTTRTKGSFEEVDNPADVF